MGNFLNRILFLFLFVSISCVLYAESVDLFEAIGWEDEAELKKALSAGGNVNHVDSSENISILMRAIDTMKPNLVQILLERKANVNQKMPGTQKTALMHFMEKFIKNAEADENGETRYVDDGGMISIFNQLIKAGAKVNDIDSEGKSVLSYAINSPYASQSQTILNKLISLKVNPNIKYSNDIPKPICLVVAEDTSGQQREAFKAFIKQKLCDPNQVYEERNQRKTTLLFIAVSKKEREEVEFLLEMGANPNKGASDTLMDYLPVFVDISNYEFLELFMKHKADPNSIENEIHIMEHAARNVTDDADGERIIDLLLKYGSNINHPKLYDSYTPYNKAVYAAHVVGKYRIEKYLEKKGAVTSDKLKNQKKNK
ncbi:MAG: hypothetical protein O9264_01495 [Leptospira sp.]|nr:hypothetical protein [Leptospira sp.]